jgi:hypothetical protein
MLSPGTCLTQLHGVFLGTELPTRGTHSELKVPGLNEDALGLLVEPLEEEQVLQSGGVRKDTVCGTAAAGKF